jgi:carboxypeptidase C (cathepsin A)
MSEKESVREPAITTHTLTLPSGELCYEARADWITLYADDKPSAEVFHVAYTSGEGQPRPLTFVFNGGPGAASAYLHLGVVGPRRVQFNDDGSLPPSPARVIDNPQTWLKFTDLVFIDPVGTGFSRTLDREGEEPAAAEQRKKRYWTVEGDLDAMGEVIRRFLTRHRRWSSPIYLAGESYGGFRVARMARHLQEKDGVGLCGALLISPALEFDLLGGSEYNVLPWIDRLPTMAAAGLHHGRASLTGASPADHLAAAERIAVEELVVALAAGDTLPRERRAEIFGRMAALIGLPSSVITRCGGRVDMARFCRELLRDRGLVCGLYDASVTVQDPFPAAEQFSGPDPTLAGLSRLFTVAVMSYLTAELGVTEAVRDYHLLSMSVNESWRSDEGQLSTDLVGSMSELRYGMALNPSMKVMIVHGSYDLVTPYFSSWRLVSLGQLTAQQRQNVLLRHYPGGHMFYTWAESRAAFFADAAALYIDA